LRAADEGLFQQLVAIRMSLGAPERGFILATGTCQQEPLSDSLLRALHAGCSAYWPKRQPQAVTRALAEADATRTARAIAAAARTVAEQAPVLLVLDEFGKTLEHFAATATGRSDAASDLFVLQELAEQSTGTSRTPIFTFTLQHLAFDDYVRQVSAVQRREWGKVQGRFEDISFLESAEQSLRLVAGALDDRGMSEGFAARRSEWGKDSYGMIRDTGLANHLPGGSETLEHCYPLHPVALLALPQLCGQLGQHGRTLFTFLASGEPETARDFLDQTPLPSSGDDLPTIQLTNLFDFFAGTGLSLAAGIGGSRWREVHERVREASTLDPLDVAVLKTVGLLNLMANSQGLRASADIVSFALSPANRTPPPEWRKRLEDLESRGFLAYRSFADEYRLWQGSDVDLRGRVADAREQLRSTSAADLLSQLQKDTPPIIAARHSQKVGMLRYFTVAYTDDGSRTLQSLPAGDPADGVVVYHLGEPEHATQLSPGVDRRPILIVTSKDSSDVRDAAIEVAAALAVLDQQDVIDDRVARRELQDRVADARNRLARVLADSYRPGAPGVEFRRLRSEGLGDALACPHGLSALLSDVCDDAYQHSPIIRNEMLGRRDLTSQGAKARRELIEAMIDRGEREHLGIKGYGPERSMYEAILRWTELHRPSEEGYGFSKPGVEGNLNSVWGTITNVIDTAIDEPATIDRIYARLMDPPIGLKEGPIPVILVAFLLQRAEDVAIYEDGTFIPTFTADVVERLVKAPRRFALKSFSTAGSRGRIMAAVSRATAGLDENGPRALTATNLRNQTVLAVAAPLLRLVRALPKYTLNTSTLSEHARAVRTALLKTREPDSLVLLELPAACGFTGNEWRDPDKATLDAFSGDLEDALKELRGAYEAQLREINAWIATQFGRPTDTGADELRAHLRHRAEPLDGKILDQRLKTFVYNASDDTLSNQAWLESIGMALTNKAVDLWKDDDLLRFRSALKEVTAAFQRVEAVYFDTQSKSLEGPFIARRLAFTTPEGIEASKVVYYDDDLVATLGGLADEVLAKAEERIGGAHGREGLVALLVERLFDSMSEGAATLATRTSTDQNERDERIGS
jgi:hypothetical protein